MKYPQPKTPRQVQAFLGLANYYRKFIRDYATIASPLFRCTEKGKKFEWNDDCQKAFEYVKLCLTTEAIDQPSWANSETVFKRKSEFQNGILLLPDWSKPFRLETDASNFGAGAVLAQEHKGVIRPCAYFS